jgi:hypothetical protein
VTAMIFHNVLVHLFSVLEDFRAQPAVVLFSKALDERAEKVSWGLRVRIACPQEAAKPSAGDD